MLGVLGMLAPDLLQAGGQAAFQEPTWFKAGAVIFSAEGLDYLGRHLPRNAMHPQAFSTSNFHSALSWIEL